MGGNLVENPDEVFHKPHMSSSGPPNINKGMELHWDTAPPNPPNQGQRIVTGKKGIGPAVGNARKT
eukprot:483193-Pelagomonas_calceolata.AAC.3